MLIHSFIKKNSNSYNELIICYRNNGFFYNIRKDDIISIEPNINVFNYNRSKKLKYITYIKFKLYGTDDIVELRLDKCNLHSTNEYALVETLDDNIVKKEI